MSVTLCQMIEKCVRQTKGAGWLNPEETAIKTSEEELKMRKQFVTKSRRERTVLLTAMLLFVARELGLQDELEGIAVDVSEKMNPSEAN